MLIVVSVGCTEVDELFDQLEEVTQEIKSLDQRLTSSEQAWEKQVREMNHIEQRIHVITHVRLRLEARGGRGSFNTHGLENPLRGILIELIRMQQAQVHSSLELIENIESSFAMELDTIVPELASAALSGLVAYEESRIPRTQQNIERIQSEIIQNKVTRLRLKHTRSNVITRCISAADREERTLYEDPRLKARNDEGRRIRERVWWLQDLILSFRAFPGLPQNLEEKFRPSA